MTISSLAINAFVFCLEVGLETPKKTETRWRKFVKMLFFSRDGHVKNKNKARKKKLKNNALLRNDGGLLSVLQSNARASLVHFACNRFMQVHCVGGQRGGHHHTVAGSVLEFSHPCFDFVLFTGPSLHKIKLFSKIYCLDERSCINRHFINHVSFLFWHL